MTPPPPPRPAGVPTGPPKLPIQSPSAPLEARAEATFNSAIKLPATERAVFVSAACGADEELQQRVRELIASHRQTADALDETTTSPEIVEELARLKPEEAGVHWLQRPGPD